MKVTVCELRNDSAGLELDWPALVEHVRSEKSELVLLPEMAFHPWLAGTNLIDPELWQGAVSAHDLWIGRLSELAVRVVIGTRPVIQNKKRLNQGYIWQSDTGYRPVHAKYYLPDEESYWEASWYDRGDRDFNVVQIDGLNIGFLICTELWFAAHAREYMLQGIDLLVCPRATPKSSVGKWLTGGRTAAVISGAYCMSSNFCGSSIEGSEFGGTGWVIEPEEGNVLGTTSPDQPFLTVEIDLEIARNAKHTYPRYVKE